MWRASWVYKIREYPNNLQYPVRRRHVRLLRSELSPYKSLANTDMSSRRDVLKLSGGIIAVGASAYSLGHQGALEGLQSVLLRSFSHTDFASWRLADADGKSVRLSTKIRPPTGAMLYFVRANCEWCSRNRVAVNAIAEQLRGKYSAIGVLTEGDWPGTKTYVFPVFRLEEK